jgi:hypothetical protein
MVWAYNERKRVIVKPKVIADFYQGILKKRSFLEIVVADPGKGKSLTVAKKCDIINPDFCRDDVLRDLPMVRKRMKEVVESGQDYRVLNLDDFGSELDPNQFNSTYALTASHIFQTYRTLHVGCFLTVPDKQLINKTFRDRLPNFLTEVIGHNERTGYAKTKMFRVQVNKMTHKVYYHSLMFTRSGKLTLMKSSRYTYAKVKSIYFQKPDQDFMEWYLPFRDELAMRHLEDKKQEQDDDGNMIPKDIREIADRVKIDVLAYSKRNKKYKDKALWNKELIQAISGKSSARVSMAVAYLESIGIKPSILQIDKKE